MTKSELEAVLSPAAFARTMLGFAPDAKQTEILDADPKRLLLNCTRQWGKSTLAAVRVAHHAYFQPKTLSVVIAPSEAQSAELVGKVREMLEQLGVKTRGDRRRRISLVLPNGSRVVGLPAKETTVRGLTASLLVVDEAAMVPDSIYRAIRPMLAVSRGKLWMMSTPFGKRGFFYDAWRSESGNWTRVEAPATECPRIPEWFLEEEREAIGELGFRQEYMCEFGEREDGVFVRELVEEAWTREVRLLWE